MGWLTDTLKTVKEIVVDVPKDLIGDFIDDLTQ
jgi:hypothetical protein